MNTVTTHYMSNESNLLLQSSPSLIIEWKLSVLTHMYVVSVRTIPSESMATQQQFEFPWLLHCHLQLHSDSLWNGIQ